VKTKKYLDPDSRCDIRPCCGEVCLRATVSRDEAYVAEDVPFHWIVGAYLTGLVDTSLDNRGEYSELKQSPIAYQLPVCIVVYLWASWGVLDTSELGPTTEEDAVDRNKRVDNNYGRWNNGHGPLC
jgi:hypothetical protein